MLDFSNFGEAFRHVFRHFLDLTELTSEELRTIPEKFSGISAKVELSGDARAVLWLNMTIPGVRIAMDKLKIASSDEDRMLMDATGELLNIIAGTGQRNSNIRYEFSLPSIYKGEAYPLRMSGQGTKNGRRFVFEDFEAYLILDQS